MELEKNYKKCKRCFVENGNKRYNKRKKFWFLQINVLIQQNHQSSTARFFLPLFVKEIETYGKRNRHLLVLYVFFVLINA